jgi:hypothetical protein
MAERRMLAKSIVLSDAFLDMPMSARCLYFTLAMVGDDDGFVNSPKSIMRQIGATVDDLKILMAKQYVIMFDSGVLVIKHWRIHNCIRKDRYKETTCKDEKDQIVLNDNNVYELQENNPGIPNGNQMETQVRLGEVSIGKDRVGKDNDIPTVAAVTAYVQSKNYRIDPNKFYNYYSEREFPKNWKEVADKWEQTEFRRKSKSKAQPTLERTIPAEPIFGMEYLNEVS